MRSTFIDSRKTMIKNEVERAINFVEYKRAQTEARLKRGIKKRTYEAIAISYNIYNENKYLKDTNVIAKKIKDALRPIRFNEGRGYFFAVSMDGVEQLYPVRPEFEGQNLIDLQDSLNSVLSSLHIINGGIMQNKGVVVRTHRSLTNCND